MTSNSSGRDQWPLDFATTPMQASSPAARQLYTEELRRRIVTGDAGLPFRLPRDRSEEDQPVSLPVHALRPPQQRRGGNGAVLPPIPDSAPAFRGEGENQEANNGRDVQLEDGDMFGCGAANYVEDGAAHSESVASDNDTGQGDGLDSDSHARYFSREIPGGTRDSCNTGRELSLQNLGNRNHASQMVGTMTMGKENIRINATVECKTSNISKAMLVLEPEISWRNKPDKKTMTTPYTVVVKLQELQTEGARNRLLTEYFSRQFLLRDRRQQWKLLSERKWVRSDGSLPEIYLSIVIIYKPLSVEDDGEFIHIMN